MELRPAIACLALFVTATGSDGAASSSAVRAELRQLVSQGRLTDLRWPRFSAHRKVVVRFYETADFAPAWVRSSTVTPQGVALIEAFDNAASKGLNPEDYDSGRWSSRLDLLRSGRATERDVARFDLALTVSALRFASDLHSGRANPNESRARFDVGGLNLASWLRSQLVDASDVPAALDSLEPRFEAYRRTEHALTIYRSLLSQGESEPFPSLSKPLKPGDASPALAQLAARLAREGDLPSRSGIETTMYSGALVEAVKHFQTRHGLEPDGIVGRATQRALNVPLRQRVQQIELALERWRWLPHRFSRPPILVNIPEFELRALDETNRAALQMKVIVGQAYGHQTPVFSAWMTHLIFRPYWDVPESIAQRELLPKAAEDPEFLAKNHYETAPVPSGGFRLRQAPGPDNALGGVKFLFPNRYDVYLHGTPSVELFSKSRRDFSHGCIRVEKPDELAAWVLRDKPEWTLDRIREAMNASTPLRVDLDAPVPVFIVYGTAVAGTNGEVRFFDDIYGYDASLARKLAAGRRAWM
ncbi:MAG TPA: L,D-transpeptidase family protein [Bryobacteraceae bacterium]|nr:L,D-transpeptidase family protein [Bryobacteraceae bacterium]